MERSFEVISKPRSLLFVFGALSALAVSAFFGCGRATAQSAAAELLLDDLFNQTIQRPEGSKFTIDLPDGTRCSSENGTPPTLSFYGGQSFRNDSSRSLLKQEPNTNLNSLGNGYATGAVLTIPLGANTKRNCDVSYNLQIAAKKLELATALHDQGIISDEELKNLMNGIKQMLLK